MRVSWLCPLCVCVSLLWRVVPVSAQQVSVQQVSPQQAESVEPALQDAPTKPASPGVLPVVAALGPGLVLHGAGAFVAGDRATAKRLLLLEGASLTLFFAASSVVALSGASRRLVGPMLPLVTAGGAVFMLGWMADIYAASTGGRAVSAVTWASPVEAELSYRYVYDPQFLYRNFTYAEATFRAGMLRVSPSGWFALDDENQRLRIDSATRVWGRTPQRKANDGSYLDLSHAYTLHRYASDDFAVWTFEGRVDGRLDLARVGPSLRGSFAEGQLGAGLELYDYDVPGARLGDDTAGLLLARFGFGVYFGDEVRRTGETLLYYDHRHDDYAAGLGVRGIGGGFLGHLGLQGHHFLCDEWGLTWLLEAGSAYIGGLGARYRYRPRRT